jgi:hypothetical protein
MIGGAIAHAESPNIYMAGKGGDSCGKFIATIGKYPPGKREERSTFGGNFVSENAEYLQWMAGFVSGFNAGHLDEPEQQVPGSDGAGMDLFMRNWCNQHPTKMFLEGVAAFINEMRANAAARR